LYEATGRYDEAEPRYNQAIEIDRNTIGAKHPDFAIDLNNLAGLYGLTGRYEDAEPLYKQAIVILEATLGPEHPNTKTVKANYAGMIAARDGASS
ncbi:MAG: tetratricopeptide repeat protein, partial [Pseudomonadota bacterium]